MNIRLQIDVSVLEDRFRSPEKKIAYAVANAINKTAKLAQRAIQLHAGDIFKIRRPDFIKRQVAILKPFASASQGRPFAEIAVGQKPRLLLPMFEQGGSRSGFVGKNVAVPFIGGARLSPESQVPESLTVKGLKIRAFSGGKRLTKRTRPGAAGAKQYKGLLGSYLVPEVGIFQRIGRAIRGKILYAFARQVRIPAGLDFVDTVQGIADRNFAKFLREEISAAVAFKGRAR